MLQQTFGLLFANRVNQRHFRVEVIGGIYHLVQVSMKCLLIKFLAIQVLRPQDVDQQYMIRSDGISIFPN